MISSKWPDADAVCFCFRRAADARAESRGEPCFCNFSNSWYAAARFGSYTWATCRKLVELTTVPFTTVKFGGAEEAASNWLSPSDKIVKASCIPVSSSVRKRERSDHSAARLLQVVCVESRKARSSINCAWVSL